MTLLLIITRSIAAATEKGFNICLIWVPNQCDIEANEIVNQLANRGRSLSISDNMVINVTEFFLLIKKRFWEFWKSMWKESVKMKVKKCKELYVQRWSLKLPAI